VCVGAEWPGVGVCGWPGVCVWVYMCVCVGVVCVCVMEVRRWLQLAEMFSHRNRLHTMTAGKTLLHTHTGNEKNVMMVRYASRERVSEG